MDVGVVVSSYLKEETIRYSLHSACFPTHQKLAILIKIGGGIVLTISWQEDTNVPAAARNG